LLVALLLFVGGVSVAWKVSVAGNVVICVVDSATIASSVVRGGITVICVAE